ncbi:hypothetical protein ACK8HX_14245 [Oryzobacter sp. R7]|uniref:hypothetical protein n=1 Tax=Oryzobacter faecalis TaxID=3388656 RepID=UPI00398CDB5F
MTDSHRGSVEREADELLIEMQQSARELEDLLAGIEQQVDEVNAALETIRTEVRAAESENSREEYDRAARSGELGPERQELQRRLDRGETTWRDVVSGRDSHPSAVAVRAEVTGTLRETVDRLEREDPEFREAYRSVATLRDADGDPGDWSDVDGPGAAPPPPPPPTRPAPPTGGTW